MSEICQECGHRIDRDAQFCPNCGAKVSKKEEEDYIDLIYDIVYIEENGNKRLSKAKMIGVGFFVLIVLSNIFLLVPDALRHGFLSFMIIIVACFIAGLFYYGICRGLGFLIRQFLIK